MTQLYAMIKKCSEHYHQRFHNVDHHYKPEPFKVEIPTQNKAYNGQAKGGPGGNYYIKELDFYVMVDDKFIKLK